MKFEQIIKLKHENFEVKVPVIKGEEPLDVAEAKEAKKAGGLDLAAYPWEQCIADQTEKYGDEETAKKVCGAIKAMYASKEEQAKEEFVIPTPESGESEQDYISRCMHAIGNEYDTQEQALAVCYSQLEKK